MYKCNLCNFEFEAKSIGLCNFTKLPFGLTKHAHRYKQSEEVLKENPQVKNIVGHSLASSVSVELTKQHPEKNLELKALYASPFIDFGSKTHDNRYRHKFDPISNIIESSPKLFLIIFFSSKPFDMR